MPKVHLPTLRVFLIFMLGFLALTVQAQENITATARPLIDTVFLLRDYQLWSVNAFTGEQTLLHNLSPQPIPPEVGKTTTVSIYTGEVDPQGNTLYYIEAYGQTTHSPPTWTRLIQVDISSGEQQMLMEGTGIYNFALSPNQQTILVTYYDGEFFIAQRVLCFLPRGAKACNTVPLFTGDNNYWLDAAQVISMGLENQYTLIASGSRSR